MVARPVSKVRMPYVCQDVCHPKSYECQVPSAPIGKPMALVLTPTNAIRVPYECHAGKAPGTGGNAALLRGRHLRHAGSLRDGWPGRLRV